MYSVGEKDLNIDIDAFKNNSEPSRVHFLKRDVHENT